MAETSIDIDCGLFGIEFSDSLTGDIIDSDLFDDGLDDESVVAEPGSEERTFTILTTLEPDVANLDYEIAYRIFLLSHPDGQEVTSTFKVSYILSDECDERLITEGVKVELPEECSDTAAEEDAEESVTEESPATEEVILNSRPIEEPLWMKQLDDQRIRFGGTSLIYEMGEPLSSYGDLMDVVVDFGALNNAGQAARYIANDNSIRVDQAGLITDMIGYNRIVIQASYEELDGETVGFEKVIYLLVERQEFFFRYELDD